MVQVFPLRSSTGLCAVSFLSLRCNIDGLVSLYTGLMQSKVLSN